METIAHHILDLAREAGEAIAISGSRGLLSYRELGLRSTELAERLLPLVTQKSPIAVATSEASRMVTGALASWIVGCPYLPVDPFAPPHRLEHVLRDSGAAVLLTDGEQTHPLPTGPWPVVSLSDGRPGSANGVIATPRAQITDAAYVIYTSGSSGLPKGVAVSHRNLSHFAGWYRQAFASSRSDRATQFASLTFDASVLEIWPTLSAGASIWPTARAAAMAETELRDFIVQHGITHCFAPTAVAEELLGLEWPAETCLRYLLTGADTLRRFPPEGLPFQLINNYGPTECTVLATSGRVLPSENVAELPSIGRPVSGARIYILDENSQPVPAGATGEIYIGGEVVSLGYIGHAAAATSERFLPDPAEPGGTMYRTGDRGRFRADGELEFGGRLDSQIKIRGFRVEPDEIVHKLRQHESVHVCAVKAIGAGAAAQLVVYLELKEAVTSDELRRYLADALPAYMVPDVFVRVDKLPLSDRGKVDMAALPDPEHAEVIPACMEEASDAQTEIETELAGIVAKLLRRPSVKTSDNFFALGGHSLLAAQVIARVRQYFGVELPMRAIFESPTVQGLAVVIEQKILAALAETPGAAAGHLPLEI